MSYLKSVNEPVANRTRCRIFGTVRYMTHQSKVRVVDLSETGMLIDVYDAFPAPPIGSMLEVRTPELGYLEGTVQWVRGSGIGLKLQLSSATAAQLRSYFRFFHEKVTPVLRN